MPEPTTRALTVRAIRTEARAVDVVASTAAIDSYGESVDQGSWQLDRYRANPIVLYAHDTGELPIGRADNVRVEDGELRASLAFASEAANPRAEQVWQLFREGVLRAVSVGFVPHSFRREMRNDREVTVLADNELLEISAVPVPANPAALALMRARAAARPQESAMSDATVPAAPESAPVVVLSSEGTGEGRTLAEAQANAAANADVAALRSQRDALLAALGATSCDAALGVVRALLDARAELATLRAEREAERAAAAKAAEAAERSALLARLTPAHRDPTTPKGAWVAAQSIETLRGYADTHGDAVPEPHREAPRAALALKPYAEMTADEKTALYAHDPALFEAHRSGHGPR